MDRPTAPRGQIFAWTLFDFANTGFHVIIITLVFPIFFKNVIAGGNEAYWGRTIAASMLVTALIGPLLGSIADATSRKKLLLGLFTVATVLATASLYFTGAGMLALAVLLVMIANIGFEGGTIFYDAFLPELASERDYARVSGYGFAMGYLGSFASLMLVLPIISGPEPDVRITFLLAAAFFGVFSLPLFLFVPEEKRGAVFRAGALTDGYRRLRDTLTHLRRYDAVKRFLLAFFVYNDSILTVLLFASIFANEELGMTTEELVQFFLVVQGSALVGSLLFGAITNRVGPRQTIILTLLIWIGVTVAGYFVGSKLGFTIIGAVAGMALGSSQSTSRAMMALLTPMEKKTEFFGFYDGFFGKASAVVGPLVFGEVSALFGMRTAMLTVGGFFLLGILLVLRVPDVRAGAAPSQPAELSLANED